MIGRISRAVDSVWMQQQRIAADLPIPGGFNNWDEYDAWLDHVIATGQHPDTPPSEPRSYPSAPAEMGTAPHVSEESRMAELQRAEDLRVLTHPHNGWTQTSPNSLEKTDWAGIHHKMTFGHPEDPVTLSSRYPEGAYTSYEHSNMRSADLSASRAGIINVLLPQLAEHGLNFHNDPNYASAMKRDEDGWVHTITPFKANDGNVWYSYSGGRSRPMVQRTERDHPTLDAAVQHAKMRRPPE